MLPLFEDLKRIFKTETGRVFLFPGSGTGGWEAAISNTLSPGDKVLAVRHGQFNHLWIALCRRHKLDVVMVEGDWREGAPVDWYAEQLAADRSHGIKAVLVCHNETSTGVTSDVTGIRRALDDAGHPALLFVDGVSSVASIDFRMDEWGVDVAVSGSQKGFMLPAGMAIVCVSRRAIEATNSAACPRAFFDFGDMIATNDKGYFPYTPPKTLIRGCVNRSTCCSKKVSTTSSPDTIDWARASAGRRAVGGWSFAPATQNGIRIRFRRSWCPKASIPGR